MNPTENLPLHPRRATWRPVLAGLIALSPVLEAEIAVPALSPRAADSPVGLDVLVTCATPGAEIRYTLNGTEPTRFDPLVASGGTVRVSRNAMLKARAWAGSEASPVTTEDYRITGSIASGDQHGLALSVSGRVWSWGNQAQGRLGNGQTTATQVLSPVQVLHGGGNFESGADLAAGFNHSLVRDQQGAVWAFGRNADGQLGVDSTTDSALPVQVLRDAGLPSLVPLDNVVAVAAGQDWSLALSAAGEPLSWGRQATGRLGSGSTSGSRLLPGPVLRGDLPTYPGLTGMRSIAAAPAFGLAREPNDREQPGAAGKVWSWGYNNTGQLGHGGISNASRALPVLLDASTPLTDAWDLAAGEAHTAIVRWHPTNPTLQGSVWAAGNRAYGRLGNGSTAAGSVSYPTPVLEAAGVPLDGIGQVAAGSAHTLALDEAGFVWSWGYNGYGQLGDGSTTNRAYAAKVKNPAGTGDLAGIVRVAAGGDGLHGASMALAADGTIYVWGRNQQGQLGNGETSLYATKLPVAHAQNHVVEGAPALTLTYDVTAAVEAGSVAITAFPSHTGPGGVEEIDRVELFLNGQLAVTFSGGVWLESVSGLAAGEYHGYGVVVDDDGVRAMSAPFTFEIELDPAGDKDGDGLTNGEELLLGTSPWNKDHDGDGLEDGYEHWHQFSPLVIEIGINGPNGDADNDQISNKSEHDLGRAARLRNESFDSTGMRITGTIRWFGRKGFWYTPEYSTTLTSWTALPGGIHGENQEVTVNLTDWYGAPLPVSSFYVRLRYGPTGFHDTDGDGLSDFVESLLGLDEEKIDSDDDGLPDGDEDTDGDGITNQSEVDGGTDATDVADFPPHYLVVSKSISQTWYDGVALEVGDPQGSYQISKSWNSTGIWDFLYEIPFSASELNERLSNVAFPASPPANAQKILMGGTPPVGGLAAAYNGSIIYPSLSTAANATSTRVWLRMPLTGANPGHPPRAFLRVAIGGLADGAQNQDPIVEIVEASFAPGSELSGPLDLQLPVVYPQSPNVSTWGEVALHPVEMAPAILAVNSDFDEGRIDPGTGYAIPDCDDPYLALEAARDHLDGKFAMNERITDDLHSGFFGVNPWSLALGDFWNGATVTIRKIARNDPATGHPESGQVRLYGKWGAGPSEYRGIVPYVFDTLAVNNLAAGGINGVATESVYGAASPFPAGAAYFMEGVHPGKITLEWRYQKGAADVRFEQTFEVVTHKGAPGWRLDLDYKIRLDTDNDPSGQIHTFLFPVLSDGYRTNMERATEFYDFYRECYREPLRSNPGANPGSLSWAGLALLAGSQVVGGLSDSEYGRLAVGGSLSGFIHNYIAPFVGGWAVNQIEALQEALFQGGWRIFRSLGWQLHAYRSSGYRAINHVAVTDLDQDAVALSLAWEELHQGVLDNDWTLLNSAAQTFADHEQNQVIVPTWTLISGMTSGPVPVGSALEMIFSILGKNPCTPSGLDFTDLFPLSAPPVSLPTGNLADAADRWTWIRASTPGGILDTWNSEPPSRKFGLTLVPLRQDALRFALFSTGGPAIPIRCWDDQDTP